MKRKNIIVLIPSNIGQLECFGNFKKLCETKEFPYHTLKVKKFPIQYGDYTIYRVPFL
jgi:hypothetical protein